METRPGFSSGNQWKSECGKSEAFAPETTGEKTTSVTEAISPA